MSPLVIAVILVSLLSVTALVGLIRALFRADEGYEDERGFHRGSRASGRS